MPSIKAASHKTLLLSAEGKFFIKVPDFLFTINYKKFSTSCSKFLWIFDSFQREDVWVGGGGWPGLETRVNTGVFTSK